MHTYEDVTVNIYSRICALLRIPWNIHILRFFYLHGHWTASLRLEGKLLEYFFLRSGCKPLRRLQNTDACEDMTSFCPLESVKYSYIWCKIFIILS